MAIQRWDPQRDLVSLQGKVNRMFAEVLGHAAAPAGGDRARPEHWKPPLDLFEEVGHYVLRADLPGVAPSEVELRIEEDSLIVAGERKSDQQAYLRMERPFGRFSAQVALPASVDRTRIHANHRNGVLEVVLPKKRDEPAGPIEITAS